MRLASTNRQVLTAGASGQLCRISVLRPGLEANFGANPKTCRTAVLASTGGGLPLPQRGPCAPTAAPQASAIAVPEIATSGLLCVLSGCRQAGRGEAWVSHRRPRYRHLRAPPGARRVPAVTVGLRRRPARDRRALLRRTPFLPPQYRQPGDC